MSQLFANRAISILQATINSSATSLTVEAGKADRFPVADTGTDPVNTAGKDWFKAVLRDSAGNWEIVYVRTRTLGSAVLSNVQRAQEGTTAIGFASGSIVKLAITAADVENTVAHPNDDTAAHAATAISNTPAGNISATTVQAAINELDTEKAAASHTHTASQITDLQEASEDIVGNLLTSSEGTGDIDWTYTDGSGTLTGSVKNDAITFAKMQNIATSRLLGRSTASSGDVEEITIGTGMSLSGGALACTVLAADFQQFDASGTWTKPSGYSASALVIMEAWGAGGGGGNGSGGSGGGGGGYARREMLYSDAASSYTVTIGAGAINTDGGNTTIGSVLTAYGGGRGRSTAGSSGGSGAGAAAAGTAGTASAGAAGAIGGNGYADSGGVGGVNSTSDAGKGGYDGGGGGGAGMAPSDSLGRTGGTGYYGGGGGGGGGNGSNQAGNGGGSYYGGAGGAGDSASGTNGSAGQSVHGGNGGAVDTAGAQPGGGGGGGSTGGAGGAGRVRITVIERV
jgi:hypothetical protein